MSRNHPDARARRGSASHAPARETATQYVPTSFPGNDGWRVSVQHPRGEMGGDVYAQVVARRGDGTERVLLRRHGRSEAEAIEALRAAMARGEMDPEADAERKRVFVGTGAGVPPRVPFVGTGAGAPPRRGGWFDEVPPRPVSAVREDRNAADLRLLGLDAMPDAAALKAAWRAAAVKHHPDTAEGSDAAFMAARAAYERLARVLGLAP